MRSRACPSPVMNTALARRGAITLALASILLLAACGRSGSSVAAKKIQPTATATSVPPGVLATATAISRAVPPNSPFVCANSAGSPRTYAFVNADHQIYMVNGCSTPVQLTHLPRLDTSSIPSPVAWSLSHRYLAIYPNIEQDYCLKIVDTQTGAVLNTKFDCNNRDPTMNGDLRTYIGWLDDNTFLGRIDLNSFNLPPDSVRIVRVDIHSRAETLVRSFAWMAYPELRAGSLFFAGRVNPNDTNAYLFRLSLANGSQTRLVGLGLSGRGNCMVIPGPCSWTAPWDVSPDGTHLLYHNPGADSLPSEFHSPGATPLFYASLDGSGAVQVLAAQGGSGMLGAQFDPTGTRVTAYVPGSNQTTDFIYQPLPQGAVQRLAGSYYIVWRDGQTVVDMKLQSSSSGDVQFSAPTLLTLSTQVRTPLAENTYNYLWAS
jgi:hypothetical protein